MPVCEVCFLNVCVFYAMLCTHNVRSDNNLSIYGRERGVALKKRGEIE